MTFPAEILDRVPDNLRIAYIAYQPEIQALRAKWAKIREEFKANPLLEHNMLTREYHPTERAILAYLCPDLDSKDGYVKRKAMEWILAQPWGEDFRPPPVQKKFRGIDLGSSSAA